MRGRARQLDTKFVQIAQVAHTAQHTAVEELQRSRHLFIIDMQQTVATMNFNTPTTKRRQKLSRNARENSLTTYAGALCFLRSRTGRARAAFPAFKDGAGGASLPVGDGSLLDGAEPY